MEGEFFSSEDAAAVSGEPDQQPSPIWIDDDAWEEAEIPHRPWIAPGYALRGAVTIMAGPPSAMKSSLALAWAVALALGQSHGDFQPRDTGKCLIFNVEDDQKEQRRRLSAVLRQFDATPADIKGKIIRAGPLGVGTLLAQGENGALGETAVMDHIRRLIEAHHPKMLIADPFAELHEAEENDNTAVRKVLAAFRSLAIEYDIAVILLHHTRKGALTAGDPDGARGASATIGAARIVKTLLPMQEEDAELFGLPTSRKARSAYVRLDDAKQNYAGIGDAQWYEKVVYSLTNGEQVPAAVPWAPPDFWAEFNNSVANTILDDIEAGLPNGRRYSAAPQADRAAWRVVKKHLPEMADKQAKAVIKTWIENGVLESREAHNPEERKPEQGLFVNIAKRPS